MGEDEGRGGVGVEETEDPGGTRDKGVKGRGGLRVEEERRSRGSRVDER